MVMLQTIKVLLSHTQVQSKVIFVPSLSVVVIFIPIAFFALLAAYIDQTICPKDP